MNITSDQKFELEKRVRQTKDKYEYTRLCVILARSEGMSPESIAQAHRISLSSIYIYLVDYEKENKTQHDQRGGSVSKLSLEQTQELITHLQKITYLKAKNICKYIKDRYKLHYSVPGIIDWLIRNEFVFKQPIKVPGKLDIAKIL
jgi:transposase